MKYRTMERINEFFLGLLFALALALIGGLVYFIVLIVLYTAPIPKLEVPVLEPVCYQLVCERK